MPANFFYAPSYMSLRAEASLINSVIHSRMHVNLAANAMPSEADNSASYAVASQMKFRPAVAMSSTNFCTMPLVPMNAS